MDTFCYLGDMLSVDGDADAALKATIHKGWNKFRQLVLRKDENDWVKKYTDYKVEL